MRWGIFVMAVIILIISIVTLQIAPKIFPKDGPKGTKGANGNKGMKGIDGSQGPPGYNTLPGTVTIFGAPLPYSSIYTPEQAYALGNGIYYQYIDDSSFGTKYTFFTTFVIRTGTNEEVSLSLKDAISFTPRIGTVIQMVYDTKGKRFLREAQLANDGSVTWGGYYAS